MFDTGQAPANTVKMKRTKLMFTKEEDEKLIKAVKQYGDRDWSVIASCFANRNCRQCRERWKKFLCPTLNHSPWTPKEDELLIKKYNQFGPKWSIISKSFKNRTDVNIKTRYIALMRRQKKNNDLYFNHIPDNTIVISKEMLNLNQYSNKCLQNANLNPPFDNLKLNQITPSKSLVENNDINNNKFKEKNEITDFTLDNLENIWDDYVQDNPFFEFDSFF